MWYDDLPKDKSWATLWSGYTICGSCSAIRTLSAKCPVCGADVFHGGLFTVRDDKGREYQVASAVPGAEGSYEDWIYLRMLEREWKRPISEDELFQKMGFSPRAAIVVLFWSYFETRVERLLRAGMRDVPQNIIEDCLQRNSSIGSRLDRFYRVVFASTYSADLNKLGYGDIWQYLAEVQARRNEFAHGKPRAIDDALAETVIDKLKGEHESWISVFNMRTARVPAANV